VIHTRLSRQQPKHTGTLPAVLRGDSRAVLLSGVALNWAGAAKLAREVWLSNGRVGAPADYDQLKAFTSGTAATFGAFYLYLYATKKPAVPLLMFGASLKTWAFVLSGLLHAQGRLKPRELPLLWGYERCAREPLLGANRLGGPRQPT
jgi:hypothetical protein